MVVNNIHPLRNGSLLYLFVCEFSRFSLPSHYALFRPSFRLGFPFGESFTPSALSVQRVSSMRVAKEHIVQSKGLLEMLHFKTLYWLNNLSPSFPTIVHTSMYISHRFAFCLILQVPTINTLYKIRSSSSFIFTQFNFSSRISFNPKITSIT